MFLDDADGDALTDRVLYASFDGSTWQRPLELKNDERVATSARLVLDGRLGNVHALWVEASASGSGLEPPRFAEVWYRTLSAGQWSPPGRLFAAASGRSLPRAALTVASAGDEAQVVYAGSDGEFIHATAHREIWATRSAGPGGAEPRLSAGPQGRLALADLSSMSGLTMTPGARSHHDPRIRLFAGGLWSEPMQVRPSPKSASHSPQVTWGRTGVLYVVWIEADPGQVLPTHLHWARSSDGRSWTSEPELAVGVPGRVFYSPRLAVDGHGAVHLTFTRFAEGVSAPRHFHMSFRDSVWSVAEEILPELGVRDSELETTVDSSGVVHAVWNGADRLYLHASLAPSADPARPNDVSAPQRASRPD